MVWGREIAKSVVAVLGCVGLLAAPTAGAAGPPLVEASWVTGVTATGATLRAQITANGLETKYRFEYLTGAAYEANLAAVPPREGFFGATIASEGKIDPSATAQTVFKLVQGLKPLTAYRYRLVATNSADTTPGPEHAFTTQATTLLFRLPDGRGWEMVSPIDKGGGAVGAPEALFGGGDFQAAIGGAAVTWGSATAFGDAAGAPPASQYVSRRGGSGWATDNVSASLESGGYGDEPDGAPYRVFSEDLSRGVMLDGTRCAVEGSCPPTYSLWQGGSFQALPTKPGLTFAGASPDLHHVVFEADDGLYEWSGSPSLAQLSADPGAALAAPIGAISEDGTRVYFNAGGNLYLRNGGASVQIDESAGGGGAFQAASTEGSVAFFTVGGALHRFEVGASPGGPIATGVSGVLGASADGSRAYFQDAGGLKLWHAGTTTVIAPSPDAAQASDFPPATGTARVSADGLRLAFLSKAELTGYDNADDGSGEPDSEVYVYGPPTGGGAAQLVCASCNPTGERPQGPSTIPGAPANGSARAYKPRVLSANGNRLVFDSADRLFALDTNQRPDVYEWEAAGEGDCSRSPGCVSLLSSGRDPRGANLLDASADGKDVYFLANESLIGADPGSIDLYDARVGGGFPEPSKPIQCIGDACQSLPAEPEDPTPGTLVQNQGNPPRRFIKEKARRHPKRRHRHRRHHHKRHHGARRGGRQHR
ncbi:MAG: hypothetical protein ACRDLL_02220 [Solirubrobacterales bacterium]